MGGPAYTGPRVFCGDLNAGPSSVTYHRLRGRMRDAQRVHAGARPRPTFPARFPIFRLDHVFISDELATVASRVGATKLARAASDHLPLIVDLAIQKLEDRSS